MPEAMLDVRPLPMEEALEYWRAKVPMPAKEFYALAENQRVNAFTVSGVADMDSLLAVQESLGTAMREGQSFHSWAKGLGELLEGFHRRRLETIFRTNIQTAYAVGRHQQMTAVAGDRPYWMYDAVNDSRTRPTHRALDGRVYRYDHPFWTVWYPPNGHRCRCSVRTLSAEDVQARGLTVETEDLTGHPLPVPGPDGQPVAEIPVWPDRGFEINPALEAWKPNLDAYPAHFRQAFLERLVERGCPELGFAEDAPCLTRLKKRLRQEDLDALQGVLWSREQGGLPGYAAWVRGILGRTEQGDWRAKGELYPVGNLPARVIRQLQQRGISPRLALVVVDDVAIQHMSRDAKRLRGAALTPDEVAAIPERFLDGDWWLDAEDPGLLLTWIRAGEVWLKVVVRLDRRIGKGIANQVTSAGAVQAQNLGQKRYEAL